MIYGCLFDLDSKIYRKDELDKIMKIVKEDDNAEIIKGALKMGGDE